MDFIFVIGISQAFFFALLLGRKKGKSVADKVLMVWLIFIGLHLLGFYWNHTGFVLKHPHLIGLDFFMPAAEGPFLWIYAQALLSGSRRFEFRWLLHFVPFFLLNLLSVDFFVSTGEDKILFQQRLRTGDIPWQGYLGNFFNLYSGPFYVIMLVAELRRFRQGLNNFFSSTEKVNLDWLRRLALGLGGIWVVVLGTYVYCSITGVSIGQQNDYYIFTAVSMFVIFLGYYGLKYENILVRYTLAPEKAIKEADKYKRSGLKSGEDSRLLQKIKQVVEEKKLYLTPGLTLDDLAEELELSRHHLSQAIGTEPGQTFFSLINQYRVEEAKTKLLSENFSHYSLLGIGLDAGFNSKASFNRVFKEYTGLTPNDFKEKYQKENV